MLQGLTGWHLLIILALILLLFGAAKLPALARSMGQSARVFRSEMKEMKREDAADAEPTASPEVPPTRIVPPAAPEAPRGTTDTTP